MFGKSLALLSICIFAFIVRTQADTPSDDDYNEGAKMLSGLCPSFAEAFKENKVEDFVNCVDNPSLETPACFGDYLKKTVPGDTLTITQRAVPVMKEACDSDKEKSVARMRKILEAEYNDCMISPIEKAKRSQGCLDNLLEKKDGQGGK